MLSPDGTPKTIKVRSDEHDGDVVRINAVDFDESKHQRVVSKKDKKSDKSEKSDKPEKKKKKKAKLRTHTDTGLEAQAPHGEKEKDEALAR